MTPVFRGVALGLGLVPLFFDALAFVQASATTTEQHVESRLSSAAAAPKASDFDVAGGFNRGKLGPSIIWKKEEQNTLRSIFCSKLLSYLLSSIGT